MNELELQAYFWEYKELNITLDDFNFTLRIGKPLKDNIFLFPYLTIESVYTYVDTKEELDNDTFIIETLLVYVSKELASEERNKAKKILKEELHKNIFNVIKNNKKYIKYLIELGIKRGFFEDYFSKKQTK